MPRPGRPFDWSEIDPLLGAESDKALSVRFSCSEGAVCRRRIKAGIRRPPSNGAAQKMRHGPTDAECRRDNERDAYQRMIDCGREGGMGGSVAGECVDRGSDLRDLG